MRYLSMPMPLASFRNIRGYFSKIERVSLANRWTVPSLIRDPASRLASDTANSVVALELLLVAVSLDERWKYSWRLETD
jgi:hypothetical protein